MSQFVRMVACMKHGSKKGKARPVQRAKPRSSRQMELPTATSARPPTIRAFLEDSDLICDSFAGGGGASVGIEMALGRSPDIAINHDAAALAMHKANHPLTKHFIRDVWEVDPKVACGGRRVALGWFSPSCTHFSRAKGGKPLDRKIRAHSWLTVRWAQAVRPRVLILENVIDVKSWGPLHREHNSGCNGRNGCGKSRADCKRCKGEGCCKGTCQFNRPIKSRQGETWRAFIRKLERLGYVVEWRLLRACDFGAPTTRTRLFMVARCDGEPIAWPTPTHGPAQGLVPFRTAAECIDWSLPAKSIFDRKKPLSDKTMARIARGIQKFVLDAARPFVIPVNHEMRHRSEGTPAPVVVTPIIAKVKTHGGGGNDAKTADEPIGTVTASKRGEFAVIAPYLVHRSNGERVGQAPRIYDAQKPLGTVVAQGRKQALCMAFLARHFGGRGTSGSDLAEPARTVTAKDHHALAVAHVVKFQGTSESHINASSSSMEAPVPTITSQGMKLAQVTAMMVRYNNGGGPIPVDEPIGTLTTKPRFGLVTVVIDGEEYQIVDVTLRMLSAEELFACNGFPRNYNIKPMGPKGKRLNITEQIRMCGNAVVPQVAAAVVSANLAVRAAA